MRKNAPDLSKQEVDILKEMVPLGDGRLPSSRTRDLPCDLFTEEEGRFHLTDVGRWAITAHMNTTESNDGEEDNTGQNTVNSTDSSRTTNESFSSAGCNTHPMHDETSFQRDMLAVLADVGDTHGLKIKKELEKIYESEVHHGRLFPNLDSLVEKGLLEKEQLDRRTNSYQLTDKGWEYLEEYRDFIERALETEDSSN